MTRTVNIQFESREFDELEKIKKQTGMTWHNLMLVWADRYSSSKKENGKNHNE